MRDTTRRPSRGGLLALLLGLALFAGACGGEEAAQEEPVGEEPAEEPADDAADGADDTGGADEADEPEEADETGGTDGELTSVSYATSFGQFGRDAYAYVALEKGYFEEAGFDVSITPGQGSADNARLIASGQLDYAPLDFSALVVTRASEDVPVKIVSFVHQQWLSAIVARGDSGIDEPADLEGAAIADAAGSVVRIMFPVYAERAGIDPDAITFRNADPPALPSLLAAGQVDAVGQFVVGEPLFEQVTGGPVTLLPYADLIPELPGIGVAAADETIEEDPEQVRAFVAALNRGLEDALEDPAEAAEILLEHAPEGDAGIATAELEIMRDYVLTDHTEEHGLGTVDEDRLPEAVDITVEGYGLDADVTVDDVYVPGLAGDS